MAVDTGWREQLPESTHQLVSVGAVPDLSVRSSLLYPFIDRQGHAEQSYMIQLIGEAEKATIVADERLFSLISAPIRKSVAFRTWSTDEFDVGITHHLVR